MAVLLRALSLVLLLASGSLAWGQAPAWQSLATINGSGGNSEVQASAADGNGNIYLAGKFLGTISLGSTTLTATSGGFQDLFVAKWNTATSSFVWAQQVSGAATEDVRALVVSGSAVYVAGNFSSQSASFGAITLVNSRFNQYTSYEGFVAKLTDAGSSSSFTWALPMGNSGFDSIERLAVSSAGIYAMGTFYGSTSVVGPFTLTDTSTSSGNRLYLVKLADAGASATFTWVQQVRGNISTNLSLGGEVGLAVSGNTLYLAGSQFGPATFGSVTVTPAPTEAAFLAKLTDTGTSGSFVWAQSISKARVSGLAVRGSDLYLTGLFRGTVAFGTTTLQTPNPQAYAGDVYVAKFTDAGAAPVAGWALRAGGTGPDSASTVLATPSGLYLTGKFASATASFGSTTLANANTNPNPSLYFDYDVFVARIVETGTDAQFAWALSAGGQGYEHPAGLVQSGSSLYVTGALGPAARFGAFVSATAGSVYATGFLASLTDQALPTRPTGTQQELALYPNPARGCATVRLPAGAGALSVVDALGRVVRTATAPAGADYLLDLTGLAPGVYAVRVGAATQKLVVE